MTVLRTILNYLNAISPNRVFFNLRTLSTLLGIVLGVAALTASFNFCDTAKKEILKSIEGMTANILAIRNNPDGSSIKPKQPEKEASSGLLRLQYEASPHLTLDDAHVLKNNVVEISSLTTAIQTVITNSGNLLLNLNGVTEEFQRVMGIRMSSGRFFYPHEDATANRVCVLTGETAKEVFGNNPACGKFLSLYDCNLLVIGVIGQFENTPFFDPSNSVFIPYNTFCRLTERPDSPDLILAALKPGADTSKVSQKAESLLHRACKNKKYKLWDQKIFIEKKKQMASTVEWLVTSISLLILLVACISCSNIMVLSVNQRRQEIGIRRAIGATKADILGMFLLEGFILISIGGILGIIGGFFLTQEILRPLPNLITSYRGWNFQFTSLAVLKVLAVLFVMAFLSSLVPSWHASTMDPVEALRRS